MSCESVLCALEGVQVVCGDEADLSRLVTQLFCESGLLFDAEARLSNRDRVDFLVGGTAVELKVRATVSAVIRQLHRYALCELVEDLVLVTTSRKLCLAMPEELEGKRLSVVCMGAM